MNPIFEKIALVFPGQGSQFIGMGRDLASEFPSSHEIFNKANHVLGFDISKLMWEGPEEELNDTINTQPALFIHSCAALAALNKEFPGLNVSFLAGHSLGEISALFAAGSISFESGLNLVRERGRLMKEAGTLNPGGMAAILGLEIPQMEEICQQASDQVNFVQIANDNCPTQVVISGSVIALEKAMGLAKEKGARRVRPLNVSIAAHSRLMNPICDRYKQAIDHLGDPKDAVIPVISNVKATPMVSLDEIKTDLLLQLTSRVRWTETIQYLERSGITSILEIGSGDVLTGLNKRICATIPGFALGSIDSLRTIKTAMEVSNE